MFSHEVETKGGRSAVVSKMIDDVKTLGCKSVTIQCDAENAMKDLRSEVIRRRIEDTQIRNTPKGDSRANGVIERGVQLEGQIRGIKIRTLELN